MRALALTVLALAGCGGFDPYRCVSDDSCQRGGNSGSCVPSGNESFCAFADPACPSRQRWDSSAPSGLAGSCVGNGVGPGRPNGGACDGTAAGASACAGMICIMLKPNAQHEAGICSQPCQASPQCGANGACFDLGNGQGSFCFQTCATSAECRDGFICLPGAAPVPICFVQI